MATLYYPIADNAGAGDYTLTGAATMFDALDETSADDATTMISRDGFVAHTATPAVKLAPITDPLTDTSFVLTARWRVSTAITSGTFQVSVYQGDPMASGVLIESNSTTTSSTTWTDRNYTLSASNVANITDFTDVWVAMIATAVASKIIQATQIKLSVPDPVGARTRMLLGAGFCLPLLAMYDSLMRRKKADWLGFQRSLRCG